MGYDRITLRNKNGTTSASRAWIVRRSLDLGNTWQTINTYQLNSGFGSNARGIGADASGNICVVGSAIGTAVKGNYYNHWVVRRSSDGGNSWSTLDDFQLDPYNHSYARSFVAAANGTFYVVGSALVGPNDGTFRNSHWTVRKSVNGGATWTTSDDLSGRSGANAPMADAFGKVFVGGDSAGAWAVRRSP